MSGHAAPAFDARRVIARAEAPAGAAAALTVVALRAGLAALRAGARPVRSGR